MSTPKEEVHMAIRECTDAIELLEAPHATDCVLAAAMAIADAQRYLASAAWLIADALQPRKEDEES